MLSHDSTRPAKVLLPGSRKRGAASNGQPPGAPLMLDSPESVLELQRTAGNRSVTALISEQDGRGSEAMAIQRKGPGLGVVEARPAKAAKPAPTSASDPNLAVYQEGFRTWWTGMPLDQRAKFFIVLNRYGPARDLLLFFKEMVYDRTSVPKTPETLRGFLKVILPMEWEFIKDKAPAELEADLTADPAKGVEVWSNLMGQYQSAIEDDPPLKTFSDRLENSLFRTYASQGLEGGKAVSGEKLDANRSLLMQMTVDAVQNYRMAGTEGVLKWYMPYVPPSKWTDVLSGSSAATAGVGSIVAIWALEGTVIMTGGIALLVVGIGLGVAAAIHSYNEKDEAEKQRAVEGGIKKAIVDGFEDLADLITDNQDVLALKLTGEARREKQKISDSRHFREWVWHKLFGSFPAGAKAGADKVTGEMNRQLNPIFKD